MLDSETDAEMISANVWTSFGREKFKSDALIIQEMERNAKYFDPEDPDDRTRMRIQVAATYAYGFTKENKIYELEKAGEMIEDLLYNSEAATIIISATDSQVKRLTYAYTQYITLRSKQGKSAQRSVWMILSNAMDVRQLWN